MAYCTNCGGPLDPGDLYCPACGGALKGVGRTLPHRRGAMLIGIGALSSIALLTLLLRFSDKPALAGSYVLPSQRVFVDRKCVEIQGGVTIIQDSIAHVRVAAQLCEEEYPYIRYRESYARIERRGDDLVLSAEGQRDTLVLAEIEFDKDKLRADVRVHLDGAGYDVGELNLTPDHRSLIPISDLSQADPPAVVLGGSRVGSIATSATVVRRYAMKGACPFECCQYGTWIARATVPMHASPDLQAPIVGTVGIGETVKGVTGEVHTTPVEAVVQLNGCYEVYKGNRVERLFRGDVFQFLSYEGEGAWTVAHNGSLGTLQGYGPACTESSLQLIGVDDLSGVPRDWWAEVETVDGLQGWVKMDAAEFDGVDGCG